MVNNLPNEFKEIKTDLELSIAEAIDMPSQMFTTWMKKASENAKTKGHVVIYDKLLPALSKGKFTINTTEVSDDSKKKFNETWKNTTVDCEKYNARKKKIEEVVKHMVGKSDG